MKDLTIKTNPEVNQVFENYPGPVRHKMQNLRALVIDVAREIDGLDTLEETLKWGEPSYLSKYGSTVRMDWKPKNPDQYAIYFKCTSRLVETFRMVFDKRFNFEGKRAIVFQLEDEIPGEELKACIKAALTYHKVKHLPTLGM
jgi:hypothetical protein